MSVWGAAAALARAIAGIGQRHASVVGAALLLVGLGVVLGLLAARRMRLQGAVT